MAYSVHCVRRFTLLRSSKQNLLILFGFLWYLVFSAVTAALIAAGGTGVLVVGSSVSDTFESLFEMLANIVLGILAAIGAFFAAIFSFFD